MAQSFLFSFIFALLSISCVHINATNTTTDNQGFFSRLLEGFQKNLEEESKEIEQGFNNFFQDLDKVKEGIKTQNYTNKPRLYLQIQGANYQDFLGGTVTRRLHQKASQILEKQFEMIPEQELADRIRSKRINKADYIRQFGEKALFRSLMLLEERGALLISIKSIHFSGRGDFSLLKARAKIKLKFQFVHKIKEWEKDQAFSYEGQVSQIERYIDDEVIDASSTYKQKVLMGLILKAIEEVKSDL